MIVCLLNFLFCAASQTDIYFSGADNSEKAPIIRPDSATKPSTSVVVPNVGLGVTPPATANPMASRATGTGAAGGSVEGRPVTAADRPLSAVERPVTATERPYSAVGGDTSEDKTSTDNSEIVHEAVDLLKARVCQILSNVLS